MAKSVDRVNGLGFTSTTHLDGTSIRAAGQRACESGKRFMTNTINESTVGPDRIDYKIKGAGGLTTQLSFAVSWRDLEDGKREVQLSVGKFVTTQYKAMAFIPVAPKQVPARTSLERFARSFRAELEAATR